MKEELSHFLDLLSAKVPSWDIDYGSCRDLLAAAFPSGRAHHQQVERAVEEFMRTIEEALIDEVGFDDYCKRFVRRTDNGGFSVLPEHLQNRYHRGSPYDKLQLFWHEDAPRRYLFRVLTTLFGKIFGRQGADNVFRSIWRSFVQSLKSGGNSSLMPLPAGQLALSSRNTPAVPERWSEAIVSTDLQRLSGNSSALGYYVEKVRERFIIRQDVKTLNQRSQWLEGRLKELKLAQEIQGAAFNLAIQRKEHELRAKQLALQHMQADADLLDSTELTPMRTENSRLTLEAEAARLRKLNRDFAPPEPTRKEASLSPDEQRANDRTACEARIQNLKTEKQKALKLEDETERILKVNAIDDALQREMERWAKLL